MNFQAKKKWTRNVSDCWIFPGKLGDTDRRLNKIYQMSKHQPRLCRRCAISEELEKYVWHKGYNLHEIRSYIIVVQHLTSYGLV